MDPKRFDPAKLGPRSMAAYHALIHDGELSDGSSVWDGAWHPWPLVVEKMRTASDILPRSCCDILRGIEWTGEALRRGRYTSKADRREILFLDLCPLRREDCSEEEWPAAVADNERLKKLHLQALSEAQERYRGTV